MKRKFGDKEEDREALISFTTGEDGGLRYRNVPPSHFIFEICSFSLLSGTKVKRYETKQFDVGGHKWRMVLYPNGKEDEQSNRQMSMFLAMTEPTDNSFGWEVNVNVTFFVYDQTNDRYLIIQDSERTVWRYHKVKIEWGLHRFLSLDTFLDPKFGFLVEDRCAFGVEIFVIESCQDGERLSFVKEPEGGLLTWKIDKFSALDDECFSEVFTAEGRKWKLKLCPRGDIKGPRTHLSVYLLLDESETLQTWQKLYAKYMLRIRDQTNSDHSEEVEREGWFDSSGEGRGSSEFMLLSALKDPSNVYLVDDCMIIEAKLNLVSVIEEKRPGIPFLT